jgi:putative ABC transport system permease protein
MIVKLLQDGHGLGGRFFMFKSYLKTAWRSVSRYKTYSTINILGLALGIASCLIIFLVVQYELGFDAFNKKADRIYRVTLNAIDFNPSVSMAITPAMRAYFPQLEQVTQVWHQSNGMVIIGKTRYTEHNYMFADEHFTKVFDYDWISGDPATALSEPNSVVLTESAARKYFGTRDAMGRVMNVDKQFDLKVTGIVKDVPGNTTLPFNFLISLASIKKEDMKNLTDGFYNISGGNTFILLAPGDHIENIHLQIPAFITANWGKDLAAEAHLPLQPLRDIHFDQRYLNSDTTPTTSKDTYWALSAVAVLIIVMACINFVNLATAQAIRRAREIGVRKVLGSTRAQLIGQFLGETTFMVLLALVIGLGGACLFLLHAGEWLNVKIGMDQLIQPSAIITIVLVTIAMILLAGLYPAFVQSAFNPISSLKGESSGTPGRLSLRKALVVVQFAISQLVIVGTLVVAYQMDFFKNQDLG